MNDESSLLQMLQINGAFSSLAASHAAVFPQNSHDRRGSGTEPTLRPAATPTTTASTSEDSIAARSRFQKSSVAVQIGGATDA